MKNQTFGVEIELTGLSRKMAIDTIAEYFGSIPYHVGGTYDTYETDDNESRTWKVVRDSSIKIEGRNAQEVEVVTPILKYKDIETLQEIVRGLRKNGAKSNSSCGIHIHIGAEKHTAKTLTNLVNIMTSKQDLIYKALEINPTRERYCKKLETQLSENLKKSKPQSLEKVADVWYDGYYGDRNAHYNQSRYHGLNLHSVFTKGTVEFRLFNSTTHAGKIKSYIQFCLAINHQALVQKSASAKPTTTTNDKYTFRTWLLRLGLIGDEFKTARTHLLAKLNGNIAWRNAS